MRHKRHLSNMEITYRKKIHVRDIHINNVETKLKHPQALAI